MKDNDNDFNDQAKTAFNSQENTLKDQGKAFKG